MKSSRQRGTAVITALLMVGIASAIAVAMMSEQRITVFRANQISTAKQAYYYAEGATYWAKAFLETAKEFDDLEWPLELQTTEIDDGRGRVHAQLFDYSALINVNDLSNADNKNNFMNMLADIEDLDQDKATEIVRAVEAWVNASDGEDEFESYYLEQKPPYRAARQLMTSVSELRLVAGVSAKIYEQIDEKVSALPEGGSGNTRYFLLRADVELGEQYLTVFSLLHQQTVNGKVGVIMDWQSRGTW